MYLKTPPMGYNTWNTFGKDIHEQLIKELADAFIENGLKDAGYEYLVIDDCWSEKQRDPVTNKIVPDHIKFPNGMNAVSDYVHSKGLKFGIYSCAGVRTCADFPGSFDHEFLDAKTFAEYGCDFLKYDFCNKPQFHDGPLLYKKMGLALKACGRDIVFSLCNWGRDNVTSWARAAGADMYRSTGDIFDNFQSCRDILLSQINNLCCSAPGCFNDLDMLTVGMYGKGNVGSVGCNDAEYRSQFALWCLCGAPLMLGCDIRNMDQKTKELITNKDLIAINQDPECRGVLNVALEHEVKTKPVFFRHLSHGKFAVGFFNFTDKETNIPMFTCHIGLPESSGYGLNMRDVFTGERFEKQRDYISFKIPPHDCRVFICSLTPLA